MNEILSNLLLAVVTAAIPVVAYYAGVFLGKLFKKIDTELEEHAMQNTLNSIFELILQVVSSTSQTYVDSLKASGSFDKEAQEKAFLATKDTIMNLLSEKNKDIITSLYGDLDTWIDVQIENSVRQLKNQ